MRRLKSSNGRGEFIVDADRADEISEARWLIGANGYVVAFAYWGGRRHSVLLHRLLVGALRGELVDHINGDPLDNRIINLRLATRSQNAANSLKIRGRSKFKGVWYSNQRSHRNKPWHANIKYFYKKIHLGQFATEQEAAHAYNEKAVDLFGEFARLNQLE